MDFTAETGIALVVGIALGFIICRVAKYIARDTGPHKITPPPPPPE